MRRIIIALAVFAACLNAYTAKAQTMEETIAELEKQWPRYELERANTAKDCPYLNDFCKQVIYFMNLARINGPLYYKTFGSLIGGDRSIENFVTLEETLNNTRNLKLLYPNRELSVAAQAHADDLKKSAHTSGDGTGATVRINVKFKCRNYAAESISWTTNTNALHTVNNLLLDMGNAPGYGHRGQILRPTFRNVGLGHNTLGGGTVFDFGYESNDELREFIPKAFSPAMIKKADVARNVNYLTEDEKDFFLLANLARLDPVGFGKKYVKKFMIADNQHYDSLALAKSNVKYNMIHPDRTMTKSVWDFQVNNGVSGNGPDPQGEPCCEPRMYKYWGFTTVSNAFNRAYSQIFDERINTMTVKFGFQVDRDACFIFYNWAKSSDGFQYETNPADNLSKADLEFGLDIKPWGLCYTDEEYETPDDYEDSNESDADYDDSRDNDSWDDDDEDSNEATDNAAWWDEEIDNDDDEADDDDDNDDDDNHGHHRHNNWPQYNYHNGDHHNNYHNGGHHNNYNNGHHNNGGRYNGGHNNNYHNNGGHHNNGGYHNNYRR